MNTSTSSTTPTHAETLTPDHPRRRWLLGIVAILIALSVAMMAWQLTDESHGPGLAGEAEVTASSARLDAPPAEAVDSGDPRFPKGEWRSEDETAGAWIELGWSRRYDLRRVILVRNPLTEPGVTAGFLSFGDGSQLQVTLSTTSPETVLPFTPRAVDRLRFTASAVADGAVDVALAEIIVSDRAGPGDVADRPAPAGNAAVGATVTQSVGGSDPRALQDGTDDGPGAAWTATKPAGGWVQLDWAKPEEITSIELVGSAGSAASVGGATVGFGDGARLPVGAVLDDPGRPTIVGFMPRVTSSLRLTLDDVRGAGPLTLSELRVYRRGATPARTPTAPAAPPSDPPAAPCADAGGPSTAGLVVRCPTAGTTVDGSVRLDVQAPGSTVVTATAWPADPGAPAGTPVQVSPDATGLAQLAVDLGALPAGPLTVRVEATGDHTAIANVQLYKRGVGGGDVASSPAAAGRTLVYDEEFDRPISISRSGASADYAAAKPVHDGTQDFGSAIFPDPATGSDNVRVVDNRYLRIGVEPSPPGSADPQQWGRTHLGGLLASARPGGSGFSAQYGYFEARMLAPAAPGTWPAFWMLPSDNLVTPTPAVAEIDAVELYGHEPTGACHSTHDFRDAKDGGVARCGQRFATDRVALSWHTYGVSVTPTGDTFYIDGQVVATAPQVAGGGAPMFFLVDLALGGGWPVDLRAVQDRAALYVDYVRVYV